MNKQWLIAYRNKPNGNRANNNPWYQWAVNDVSLQQAEHAMKRQMEQNGGKNEWAVFEMVSAFVVKSEFVAVDFKERAEGDAPAAQPEAPPPPPAPWVPALGDPFQEDFLDPDDEEDGF